MMLFSLILYGVPLFLIAATLFVASKGLKFYWETVVRPGKEAE